MSAGGACTDKTHRPYWYVTARNCNYSAFNGYHQTYSDYSEVWCGVCPAVWRTKAGYVEELPAEKHRIVPSTSKELMVICPCTSWSGAEGPVQWLGRWPILWQCDGCGRLRLDEQKDWMGPL